MPRKNKISAIAIIILLFVIPLILNLILVKVQAQEAPALPEGVEKIVEVTEKLSDEDTRSEYLKQEWLKILKKYTFFSAIDNFFKKNSIVFSIIFNRPYSFSLTLFFVIVFWFIFALGGAQFIKYLSKIESSLIPIILGMLLAVILAHVNLFYAISKLFIWFLFFKKEWYWEVLIFFVEVIVIIIIVYFIILFSKAREVAKIIYGKKEQKKSQTIFSKFFQGLKTGSKE